MSTNVATYLSNQFNNASTIPPADYVNSVKILENSGFSSFSESNPLSSTLTQIFDRFVQKTGLDTDSNKLQDEFLHENPSTRKALNLYSALENTFATQSSGQKASIVDFLNTKIDDLVSDKDVDGNKTLNQEESGFDETFFNQVDKDQDYEITGAEIKNNFFSNFSQLNNVLNYFQSSRGNLVDVLA